MLTPGFIRSALALAAALVLVAAAPIHAQHGHDASSPSATVHASCAVCHAPAPAGTCVAAPVSILEPGCAGHLPSLAAPVRLPDARGRVDACRAPPAILALD